MKIVILDGRALNPVDLSYDAVNPFGDVTLYQHTDSPEEAIARIGDSQIVLTNKVPITRQILEACPNIQLICVLATGYNIVDVDACREKGIPVCNVPSYGTAAVAQFTLALMLEICHRIGHHDRVVHDGKWCECSNFCFWDTPQMELGGKTLGIIGYGTIGRAVGRIAEAMGMRVLRYSRTQHPGTDYVDLDTLLRESDIISLHAPLFPETFHLINAETLAKMKNGAILLNTARGPLIDEAAVADALRSGKLRGAAVDVVDSEPIPADSPLLSAPNCIITPHMAWAPLEARQRIMDICAESIRAFLKGERKNVVNL